jgi:HD-GYP domain-containing protein (c-di-GMP phosphodiesterase class II)
VPGDLTLVEVSALLAVAQDHAFAQPPGSQLRATVLAQHLAVASGFDSDEQAATWFASTLRFLGCTGHAFDMAVVFGDEIEMRADAATADFANPFDVLRVMVTHAGSGEPGVRRLRSILSVLAGGKKAAEMNFRAACEVSDVFAKRLGLDEDVRAALGTSFERWNGRGLPTGVKGDAIPAAMRVANVAQDYEVLARIEGVDRALEILRRRRGKAYDPALIDVTQRHGRDWWEEVEPEDPWDAALAVAPAVKPLDEEMVLEALLVLADFADLKSPWLSGHSRAVAAIAGAAAGPDAEAAALVHDFGCVSVPNTVWDKPGALTRDERDRAETHALVTDQLLRRVPYLAELGRIGGAAHERIDGSGYVRGARAAQLDRSQRVIAAADCYVALTSDSPHRPALAADAAAKELRAMSACGQLDGDAVEAVLGASGHRRRARTDQPGGLTAREVEVVRLVALGLTTREVGDRLVISAKTADHHIQNIYAKLGVSTRGAATLFAIEQGILPADA